MLIVDCIEQTPGKLLLSTCLAWQGGSILGTRGSISSSGERGKEGEFCNCVVQSGTAAFRRGEDVAIGSDARCGVECHEVERPPSAPWRPAQQLGEPKRFGEWEF